MADIASRVKEYREEIKSCILTDSVLSNLQGIVPEHEVIRLRQLYDNDRPKATSQMLDKISESKELGKWQIFMQALRVAEYPYLAYLLETSSRPSQNYDHEKKVVQIFWPYLVRRIDPAEFVHYLYSADVIKMEDAQFINSKHNNVGQQAGAVVLLERIQCRQAPEVWYGKLLDIMMENSLDDLVKEMEPDFYASKIIPGHSPMDCSSANVANTQPNKFSSIRETVLKGSGEAFVENNLSQPDLKDDSQAEVDSVTDEEFSSIGDSITQAKELTYNIKLNVAIPEDKDESKVLNVEPFYEDVSDDDFHDAVEVHGEQEPSEENDNRQNEIKEAENGDNQIHNRQQTQQTAGRNEPEYNEDDEIEIYNRQQTPQSTKSDELEESDDDNLASDDDFLVEESEGLDGVNPYDKLKLRYYQLELAEKAVRGDNTIICAETGSGKTWVALHIVKNHLDKNVNGKVVFMARTGALIKQQSDRFKRFLPMHETILLTGDSDNSNLLGQLLEGFQIFCMTPQILLNNLERNPDHNAVHNFTLFIFDECHHTKKDEPYNKVMRLYLQEKFGPSTLKLPQIIGLTASLGVGKSYSDIDARDYILSICANLDARNLSTVDVFREELKKHVNLPKEGIVQMKERKDDPCKDILKMSIKDIESKLDDLVVLNTNYIEIMNSCPSEKTTQEYVKWTYELMKVAKHTDDDYEDTRNISTCAKYLSVLSAALEVNSLLRTEDVQKFLSDRLGNDLKDKSKLTNFEKDVLSKLTDDVKKLRRFAREVDNPNVILLSQTLRQMMNEKGEEPRAMIFVKARATCKSLSKFLDADLADIGIKVAPLYGKENRDDEEGMTEGRQNETVERFRNGEYKVLVATSVGSEGIDVPDCNIVLSYNYTGNEITKIQMSGRSRKKGGVTVVVGDEDIVRRERINAFKASMMYRAMKLVKLLDQRDYDRKIQRYQKEEVEQAKFEKKMEELAKHRKVDESVFELKCSRCNAFACYSSDIKVLKRSQHIVVDKEFETRIKIKPHRSPKKYEGMTKTSKMYCVNCPLDWGVVLDYNGLSCWTLKLANFKVINTVTKTVREYQKWKDVPFLTPTTEFEELFKLFK